MTTYVVNAFFLKFVCMLPNNYMYDSTWFSREILIRKKEIVDKTVLVKDCFEAVDAEVDAYIMK